MIAVLIDLSVDSKMGSHSEAMASFRKHIGEPS